MKLPKFYVLMLALLSAAVVGFVSCGGKSTLTIISVSPTLAAAAMGTTVQFTAKETLDDNSMTLNMTNLVSWSSSDPAIATINAAGLATAVAVGGPVTITATDTTNHISATAQLSVASAALASIAVTPTNQTITGVGATQQFTAVWNGGAGEPDITKIVSWSSSDPTIVSIDSNGLATAVAVGGPVTITATYATITGSTQLTVN
jgi:uncharacterized protein YjdB